MKNENSSNSGEHLKVRPFSVDGAAAVDAGCSLSERVVVIQRDDRTRRRVARAERELVGIVEEDVLREIAALAAAPARCAAVDLEHCAKCRKTLR